MRITMTIDKNNLDQLLVESGEANKSAALRKAVVFYIQRKKIERIKQMKGKVMFDQTANEIRHSV